MGVFSRLAAWLASVITTGIFVQMLWYDSINVYLSATEVQQNFTALRGRYGL